MPQHRKTRKHDETADWHEKMVKDHYLALDKGELPAERLHISSKHYDEDADRKYAAYLREVKKHLRSIPKMGGRRRHTKRKTTRRR
jgi:hypothetical protein